MENHKILTFQIFSILFSFVLGTLLHFTYGWSGNNTIVASFSAVNESIWEHLKLVFFPMLIASMIGYLYLGREYKNYGTARAIGIITAITFITVFYYTYTGIIGNNYAILDIGSFFVAIILGEVESARIMQLPQWKNEILGITSMVLLLISFILFTYLPPKLNYFKDPVDGKYGINSIGK